MSDDGVTKPRNKWLRWGQVAAINVLVLVVLVGLVEVSARVFSDAIFLGNSRNLFVVGTPRRNAPNVKAVSFSATVYTDGRGYRVPSPGYQYPSAPERRVVVIGDSVAFGPGVKEEKTFVGLLRQRFKSFSVENTAVIGYTLDDYQYVVNGLTFPDNIPTDVILVYCLNDPSSLSAQELEELDPAHATIRKIGPILRVHRFLRSHSIFYNWLKGALLDLSARNYFIDAQMYMDSSRVSESVKKISQIRDRLAKKNVRFHLIVSPYEYQVRSLAGDSSSVADDVAGIVSLPQKRLSQYLEIEKIDWVDARPWFKNVGQHASSEFFLPDDPMHFSALGHATFFKGFSKFLSSSFNS